MAGFVSDVESARQYYSQLGFDTLPLLPGEKRTDVKAWQSRPSYELWKFSINKSNIGIRCGGTSRIAVIDCDDKEKPGTANNVVKFLSDLGIVSSAYPLIRTASGIGRHIYIKTNNVPKQRHYSLVAKELGSGEFRFGPGAYVVAPPSVISKNNIYQLISGDFRKLPEVDFKDLLPILNWEEPSVKYTNKTISRYAYRLLKGELPNYFPSRSEAEQSLICSLINTGHDLVSIKQLFIKYPCSGKFKEKYYKNQNAGLRYLRHSYYSALEWTQSHTSEGRQLAQDVIEWALQKPWPGRTGAYDRDILLAHAQIAWRCGKVVYAASCRELAELANVSHMAATNGTKRLLRYGFVCLEKPAVAKLANMYKLIKTFTLPQDKGVRKCKGSLNHDVFCYQGLGKSSKLIIQELQLSPRTIDELVKLAGKTKPTIKKWLQRMSRIIDYWTGEIIPLVYQENGRWFVVDNPDFDNIAKILNVDGKQENRKKTHRRDRNLHARSLSIGQR